MKGSRVAGQQLLIHMGEMKNTGNIDAVAEDLRVSGKASLSYGDDGQLQHIIFNGSGDKAAVDLDVQSGAINGQSADQVRGAAGAQAKAYFAASLADQGDPALTGLKLTAEEKVSAYKLFGAWLDGNVPNLTEAAQHILHNPDMAQKIENLMERLQ